MKMKLKSSARTKRRYILIEAKSREDIESAILNYLGILGWARASPLFVSTKKGRAILAVDRGEVNNIRAAFELAQNNIKVLKVSGTLKRVK